MLVVIPFFAGDKDQAIRLVNWIAKLGGVGHHDCLLVRDGSASLEGVIEPCQAAFRSASHTKAQSVGEQGKWGTGTTDATAANEMWLTASTYVAHKFRCRWFWLEPDAVPVRSTWANELEAEDREARKPFMGAYVNIPPHEPHMSGIAVYPPNVPDHSLDMAIPGKIAWDYAGRRDTVGKGKAHFTKLIQHEYRIHGESPAFPNAKSLSVIKPETAVFHRCKPTKDEAGNTITASSLIDRLEERLATQRPEPVVQTREQTLEARVKELEAQIVAILKPINTNASPENTKLARLAILDGLECGVEAFPISPGCVKKIKQAVRRKQPMKKKRTKAEQDAINARMAKLRARKKVAA